MITYTRYLYNLDDVKMSFIISLLNKDLQQAYFWAFEMYYSGYEDKILQICLCLYTNTYVYRKAVYEKLVGEYNQWKILNDPLHLANIVKNLVHQNISISRFIKTFLKYKKVKDQPRSKAPSVKFLYASNDEIKDYETVASIEGHNYKLLKFVAKYEVRREFDEMFKSSHNSIDELRNNWLYHASHCPLWQDRIEQCGGTINHKQRHVYFMDSNSEEAFYNMYDFEPDEQSLNIQNTLVGNQSGNKLDIRYLCEFYGGILG